METRKLGSTDLPILFFMVSDVDHISGATGLAPSVTLSKNGAAFGAAAGSVSEVGNGWYALAGHATDRSTLGALVLHATATGADPTDKIVTICRHDETKDIFKLLGDNGHNVRDDVLTRNGQGMPLTFRRRYFPDAATANASTPGGTGEGELFTVTGSTTYLSNTKWETILRVEA